MTATVFFFGSRSVKNISIYREEATSTLGRFHAGPLSSQFGEVWFLWREENRRTRKKNSRSKARTNKKTNPHMEPSGNQTCPGHIINARRALSPPRHTELLIYLKYLCHKLLWLGRPIVHLLGTFYWTGHSVCNHYGSCRYKPGQKSFRIRSSRPELGLRLILEAKLGS